MPAATILKHTATACQALTLAGFVFLIVEQNIPLLDVTAWFKCSVLVMLPIIIQAIACHLLRDPVIYVASILASLLIIVFLCGDLLTPLYFPVSLLFSLPAVVITMFLGWAAFLVKRGRRVSKPRGDPGTQSPGTSD